MRHEHYILTADHKAKPVSANEWAIWFQKARDERKVAVTDVNKDIKVSTVFLGLDHNFSSKGPPHIFETLVFGGTLDGEMDRYSTWAKAERGHKEMVVRVIVELAKRA